MAKRREHEHPEAFLLMEYVSNDGSEREVLWNSRDGVTPFCIKGPSGTELTHRDWSTDRYAPDHVPKVGDRIFVDLTMQRATIIAAKVVEHGMKDAGRMRILESRYPSQQAAVKGIADEMLAVGPRPDILVVTDGYLRNLVVKRAMRPGAIITGADYGSESVTKVSVVRLWPDGAKPEMPVLTFDRQGNAIEFDRFVTLMADEGYVRVALTVLSPENGDLQDIAKSGTGWFLSTVWLGMPRGFGDSKLIFQSIAWRDGEWGEERLYATEAQAIAGHAEFVAEQLADEVESARKKN